MNQRLHRIYEISKLKLKKTVLVKSSISSQDVINLFLISQEPTSMETLRIPSFMTSSWKLENCENWIKVTMVDNCSCTVKPVLRD